MTPEIQQQLIDWLKNLGNLAAEELPTFVQEVAIYGFYSSISNILVNLVIVLLFYIPFRLYIKYSKDVPDPELARCVAYLLYIMLLIMLFKSIGDNASSAIKAYVSPRLYAIESLTK